MDNLCKQDSGINSQPTSGSFVVTGANNYIPSGYDITLTYQDHNGQTQTGYTVAMLTGPFLYFPENFAIGNSPSSRPITVDQTVAFTRVQAGP